jgi:dsRNA-specific ribonuclease
MLEAVTHKSAKENYGMVECYEKLEVLGDAILEFMANFNIIRYTLFERYKPKDFSTYKHSEDFCPADAH